MSVFIVYILLDLICIGMGMGVPVFPILLGFPVGWFLVKYVTLRFSALPQVMNMVLKYALVASAFTLVVMLVIWGPAIALLFDPSSDLANWGIPMILYEPRASFIGWMVLMILVSPFLQLMAMVFSAYLILPGWMKRMEPYDRSRSGIASR